MQDDRREDDHASAIDYDVATTARQRSQAPVLEVVGDKAKMQRHYFDMGTILQQIGAA
jgi:hypothetical protein